jgi:hypothetical protein
MPKPASNLWHGKSQDVHKKPIMGLHVLPYWETGMRDFGLYPWWALCLCKTFMNMNKKIKIALVGPFLLFFFALAFSFNTSTASASTCNTYGNTTYCSDGTSYNTYGNTTYGSDGSTYNTYGGTTYVNGANGYTGSANTYGGTTYYNGSAGDNWTANTYGNTTYINGTNGTTGTINTYGGTSYGDGNAFSTCPANSTANSSGKCSCNYGYSVNSGKTACVYTGTSYSAPTTSSCPLNSYSNGTSCTCNYGYSVSGGSCVAITQVCQNKYGYNSYGSGTSCYCSTGYQWNSTQTSCVATTYTAPSSVTTPPSTGGGSCSSFGAGSEVHGSLCYCSTGYQWNGAINSCVIGYPTFTRSLSIGSTGTEVVNLKNLLAVKALYTGYVSTAYDKDTATAVSLYQALHNISPTGTVGPLTRAALNKSIISGY